MVVIFVGMVLLVMTLVLWDFPRGRGLGDGWRWHLGWVAYVVGFVLALYGVASLEGRKPGGHADGKTRHHEPDRVLNPFGAADRGCEGG